MYQDKDSPVFHEAFTEEVCQACYLNASRLQKRLMRVPSRAVVLAGRHANYSALLMRGIYPWDPTKPCQDSFFVSENIVVDGVSSHWFAVMDGHGSDGHGCAMYVRENLEKVARKIHKQQPSLGIEAVLTRAYEHVNDALHATDKVSSVDSGSTLVSCVVQNNLVYCANVGDSRAIVRLARVPQTRASLFFFAQRPGERRERYPSL